MKIFKIIHYVNEKDRNIGDAMILAHNDKLISNSKQNLFNKEDILFVLQDYRSLKTLLMKFVYENFQDHFHLIKKINNKKTIRENNNNNKVIKF